MLSTIFYAVVIAGAIALLYCLLKRSPLAGWLHLARTKVGQAGDCARTIDPAGQLMQAAKDAEAELGETDEALKKTDVLLKQLKRQLQSDKTAKARLEVLVKSAIDGGAADNDTGVVSKLTQIRTLSAGIAAHEASVADLELKYAKLLKKANAAGDKINATKAKAKMLGVQIQIAEQTDSVRKMLADAKVPGDGSVQARLDEFERAAQERLDGYASAEKVAADRGYYAEEEAVAPESDPALAEILKNIQGSGS